MELRDFLCGGLLITLSALSVVVHPPIYFCVIFHVRNQYRII